MTRYASVLPVLLVVQICLAASPGYYRSPALSSDRLVFTAEGDLWVTGISGGTAQRLTTHPGIEIRAAVSPDGRTIAFCAQYEGPTEIYTMPIDGGLPRRRTFDGAGSLVVGWTPDGRILFASSKASTLPDVQLFTLDLQTGAVAPVPLAQASDGGYDAAGTLFFTRLPFQGSHTKRYAGGTAQNIWRYDRGAKEAVPLTADYDGTSKTPMPWNGRVYFATDRDGTMNLWSMRPDGTDLRQHTHHKGFDVRMPSLFAGRIAYQLGADIRIYDIAADRDALVPITLASDFDQLREKVVKDPMNFLTSVSLSPAGDRIALTARGQVFVAPVEAGRFVRVTRRNDVRYRNARFLSDGNTLAALSDETGETEFWTLPANGVGDAAQVTRDATVLKVDGEPSPDGAHIAYTDKDDALWILDVKTKQNRRIAVSRTGGYGDFAWSPDSKWLAFVEPASNRMSRIRLYHPASGRTVDLTSARVDSYNPVWSPDGKWIYFLSDRSFQSVVASPWGPRQPEPFFDKTRRIYATALTPGIRFPFLPPDELTAAEKKDDAKKDEAKDKKDEKKGAVEVAIDTAGLEARTFVVPVGPGAYGSLAMTASALYWIERVPGSGAKSILYALEIKNRDAAPKSVMEDVTGYELSQDRKKLLVRKAGDMYVFDAGTSAPGDLAKSRVNLAGWMLPVDPRLEWKQMFVEAWRLERDYFYDRDLHGVDWKAVLARHLPLVDRVTDRDELSDLISMMVGELSALHTFVTPGDARRSPDMLTPGGLGAVLARDDAAGGYRVQHIYRHDPDYADARSPLDLPGVDVREGDVLLAINGVPLLSVESPALLLKNETGRQTLLHVKPASSPERDVVVQPLSPRQEWDLRYTEWELTRRQRVERESDGAFGYVHLRAMGAGDYADWVREYYPVFDRKGLIIDVRHNNGGNIDSWILEKLLRKAWFYWQARTGEPFWNMQYAFRGHMVVLCDANTASDGEAFTEGFKRLGLGKAIGTRTWGGEIWLSMSNLLVDNGVATAGEIGVFGPSGHWLIEGRGVEPDITVDNLPHATYEGEDAQLEAAIAHLRQLLKEQPVDDPKVPPYPNKAFKYE